MGIVSWLVAIWLVYHVLKALYNISPLHPLSHIPGPKLAAATYLPEFFYDVILFGRYTRAIHQMHDRYGPLVRINPNDVHCNDANFSDEIYAVGGRKRNKSVHDVNGFSLMASGFSTVDHDLHRERRIPLARFFSRAMITRLEDDVHQLVQKLCDKMLAHASKAENEPLDVAVACSAFTTDIISAYCFGQAIGILDQPSWYPNLRAPTEFRLRCSFYFRFFPLAKNLDTLLGKWLVDYLPTTWAHPIRIIEFDIPVMIERAKAEAATGREQRPTVFGSLLASEPDSAVKGNRRLISEAAALLGGGTETTSGALAVIIYYLLAQPDVEAKLRAELRTVVDDPKELPAWAVLESLPYLGAVIQEGLRLSYGVSMRIPRVATQEDLVYRGYWDKKPVQYVIPRGYAVGMSSAIMHHNETTFPDSHHFLPDRWLDEDKQRRRVLEKGMFVFSRGSRSCIGMNLAMCELYVCLAALVLRVMPYMRLYETTNEDVAYDHDLVIAHPKSTSLGVRVKILNKGAS